MTMKEFSLEARAIAEPNDSVQVSVRSWMHCVHTLQEQTEIEFEIWSAHRARFYTGPTPQTVLETMNRLYRLGSHDPVAEIDVIPFDVPINPVGLGPEGQ